MPLVVVMSVAAGAEQGELRGAEQGSELSRARHAGAEQGERRASRILSLSGADADPDAAHDAAALRASRCVRGTRCVPLTPRTSPCVPRSSPQGLTKTQLKALYYQHIRFLPCPLTAVL